MSSKKPRRHLNPNVIDKLIDLDEKFGGHATGFLGKNVSDVSVPEESLGTPEAEEAFGTDWLEPAEGMDFSTGLLEEVSDRSELLDEMESEVFDNPTLEKKRKKKLKRKLRRIRLKETLFGEKAKRVYAVVIGSTLLFFLIRFMSTMNFLV